MRKMPSGWENKCKRNNWRVCEWVTVPEWPHSYFVIWNKYDNYQHNIIIERNHTLFYFHKSTTKKSCHKVNFSQSEPTKTNNSDFKGCRPVVVGVEGSISAKKTTILTQLVWHEANQVQNSWSSYLLVMQQLCSSTLGIWVHLDLLTELTALWISEREKALRVVDS